MTKNKPNLSEKHVHRSCLHIHNQQQTTKKYNNKVSKLTNTMYVPKIACIEYIIKINTCKMNSNNNNKSLF